MHQEWGRVVGGMGVQHIKMVPLHFSLFSRLSNITVHHWWPVSSPAFTDVLQATKYRVHVEILFYIFFTILGHRGKIYTIFTKSKFLLVFASIVPKFALLMIYLLDISEVWRQRLACWNWFPGIPGSRVCSHWIFWACLPFTLPRTLQVCFSELAGERSILQAVCSNRHQRWPEVPFPHSYPLNCACVCTPPIQHKHTITSHTHSIHTYNPHALMHTTSTPHATQIHSHQSVQSLSRVRLFVTPWMAARQASLSSTMDPRPL